MPPIRFAILGTAKIARKVAPGIQAVGGAELSGIASRSLEAAQQFASELQIPQAFASYQEALDCPDIDAVYIPLPPSMHLEWTIKAAQAGKHVLCEKPLARNADESALMISVCREHNVVLLDGVMWYHTPRAQRIQDVIASGQLGDIRQTTSVFTFRWDTMPMDNLRLHRDLGGGALLDLGWYCVGAALLALNAMPRKVYADAKWHNDVDTRLNAMMWFDDDRMASIECGFDTVFRRWFEIAGTKESLVCSDFTRAWNPDHTAFSTIDADGTATETDVPQKPQEESMVEAFCDLIRTQDVQHRWIDLSHRTQRVCDALERSAREDKLIEL